MKGELTELIETLHENQSWLYPHFTKYLEKLAELSERYLLFPYEKFAMIEKQCATSITEHATCNEVKKELQILMQIMKQLPNLRKGYGMFSYDDISKMCYDLAGLCMQRLLVCYVCDKITANS